MITDNINRSISTTEVPPKDAKTELTDEELLNVSAGGLMQNCTQGQHIKNVVITR